MSKIEDLFLKNKERKKFLFKLRNVEQEQVPIIYKEQETEKVSF